MKHFFAFLASILLVSSHSINSSLTKTTSSDTASTQTRLTSERAFTLAQKCLGQHEYAQALRILDILLKKEPNKAKYIFSRANALNMLGKMEEALTIYKHLLAANPNNAGLNYHVAFTLKCLGKLQEATPYYQAALKAEPDHIEANFSLGLSHLTNGDFVLGFAAYEWRFKRNQQKNTLRTYEQPTWDGSPLDGKRIFLYAEQGLGDTFQFIRYAREAKKHGGHVIIAVQKPLVTVLQLCPFIDEVILLTDTPPAFDVHAPLMSLPHILKTSIDTVPNEIPYLHADTALTTAWQERLAADTNFKIGVCWQGNKLLKNPLFKARAIQCAQLKPLGTIPHASVYALQQKDGIDQITALDSAFSLITFEGDFDNKNGRFMDTAAVMKNLDLVITVDTSVAHLAAGLGIPTWILLPEPADWRWMLHRTDTPWYPTVRLFRQTTNGEWDPVIQTIVQELLSSNAYQQKISTLS